MVSLMTKFCLSFEGVMLNKPYMKIDRPLKFLDMF